MKKIAAVLVLLCGLLASEAKANCTASLPFNLQPNTLADASQVMSNFNAIIAGMTGSCAGSGVNSDITALTALVVAANTQQVSFFDFVPTNLQASIVNCTNATDLGVYWTTFRNAVAAMSKPQGFIPAGCILTSTNPNWAIQNLKMRTGGDLLIQYTGTGVGGLVFDGTAGGVGCISTNCFFVEWEKTRVQATNSTTAVFIKSMANSIFTLRVMGATTYGIYLFTNTTTLFINPQVCGNFTVAPTYGFYVTGDLVNGQSSDITVLNPNFCGNQYGLYCDFGINSNYLGGTSESNSNTNIFLTQNCANNAFYGQDLENAGGTSELYINGSSNTFYSVFGHSLKAFTIDGAGGGGGNGTSNKFFAGGAHIWNFTAGTKANLLVGAFYDGTYTDNGILNTQAWVSALTPGFNFPIAGSRVAVTVTASPVVYCNTTGNTQVVYIIGGTLAGTTLTRGSLGGIGIGSPTQMTLDFEDCVSITYTGAPTNIWAYPFPH